MKRWDYNSLKGEVWLFLVFLSIMLFEIFGVFYTTLAKETDSLQTVTLLVWVSRIVVAFYMFLAGWLFFRLVEKQGSI